MRRKAAFVICRPGGRDGNHADDVVLLSLAASRMGLSLVPVAADVRLTWALDYTTSERLKESRRLLSEAARLREGVSSIDSHEASEFDAVVIPGGEGLLNVYTNFRTANVACRVEPSLAEFIVAAHGGGLPIGTAGVAGFVAIRAIGAPGEVAPSLTVGPDAEVAGAVERLGAVHVSVRPTEAVVDEVNRLVLTPGAASGGTLDEVLTGLSRLVDGVIALCETPFAAEREAR